MVERRSKQKRRSDGPPFPVFDLAFSAGAKAAREKDLYFWKACSTATAMATEAPTMGLLPMPIRPIIST